jgi:hypothetical protein
MNGYEAAFKGSMRAYGILAVKAAKWLEHVTGGEHSVPHYWKDHCDTCKEIAANVAEWKDYEVKDETEAMGIYEILAEIEQAYPEDIFTDTTKGEREDVMERYPGFIDRTSAMMGRHLAKVIRRKLEGQS